MTLTSPPEWTAATLAVVRRQLLDATAFGAVLSADQVDDVLARLDDRLKRPFRVDGLNAAKWPLHPRSLTGCPACRQPPL